MPAPMHDSPAPPAGPPDRRRVAVLPLAVAPDRVAVAALPAGADQSATAPVIIVPARPADRP